VESNLFGELSLVRTWRRIGQPSQTKIEIAATEHDAQAAMIQLTRQKQRKGYTPCQRLPNYPLIHLLYAPLTIPLVYCHINNFQRASSLAGPFQGGEMRTAVWASHHEELCSDGVVAPPVCAHMVVPHCWVVLDG